MATAYHKQVENALKILGHEWKEQGKIKHAYRGCEIPLCIVDPRSKMVVNYQPDAYYILRNNKKLIFEVLDTELRKQDAIIADVICSFLIENVDGLIFLYSGSQSDEWRITEAFITIYRSLIKKGIQESDLPSLKKTGAYLITKREAANAQKIRGKLTKYAEEEHWFKTLPTFKKSKVTKR